ncbi:MAG TPA: tetratricopeptide repeat protein [Candidatus Obscuribacterales bacterium]
MSPLWGAKAVDIKIEELLLQAGLISRKDHALILKLAEDKRLHIDQLLVTGGYVSSLQLRAAVEAQAALRERAIDMNVAIRCLKAACTQARPFKEVLAEETKQNEGPSQQQWTRTCRLGELLTGAEILRPEQEEFALKLSLAVGIPFERVLYMLRHLSESQLAGIRDILSKLRDGALEYGEAVEAAKELRAPIGDADEGPRVRVGELLLLSGIITAIELNRMIDKGLVTASSLGTVLAERGLIARSTHESALRLRKMIHALEVDVITGARCLAKIHFERLSFHDALQAARGEQYLLGFDFAFSKFLVLSGTVSQEDLHHAMDLAARSPEILARMLLMSGNSDEGAMTACLRVYERFRRGLITQDGALALLAYCRQKGFQTLDSNDPMLVKLGWHPALLPSSQALIAPPASGTAALESLPTPTALPGLAQAGQMPEASQAAAAPSHPWQGAAANAASAVTAGSLSKEISNASAPLTDSSPEPALTTPANVEAAPAQDMGDTANSALSPPRTAGSAGKRPRVFSFDEEEMSLRPSFFSPTDGDMSLTSGSYPALRGEKISYDPPGTAAKLGIGKEKSGQEAAQSTMQQESNDLIASYRRLGESYRSYGEYDKAQGVFEEILALQEKAYGPSSPILFDTICDIVGLCCVQGNADKALLFAGRAAELSKELNELAHTTSLGMLSQTYFQQGMFEQCEPLLRRELEIRRNFPGEDKEGLSNNLKILADVLRRTGRQLEAVELHREALDIVSDPDAKRQMLSDRLTSLAKRKDTKSD